MKQPLAIR